ncbi:MAG: WYL domain-containing protein [Anaeromicrobium sp.]|uniref:helix-turn-helix transcriptional regulator n=1 Tax=Anaeromicrobium sp. TaxID=1929132 RepID=UPI0025D4D4BE|nr:WYL domain-containing protein [Anaeromicrobium sp.]MCT4594814.1 WYL domain-containing protein [Anaeromicrobium sp.]
MGKITNAIKMLILLKSHGRMKVREIAEELNISEKTVRRLKNELWDADIRIFSYGGKDVGYHIDDRNYMLGVYLTDEEYLALNNAKEELKETNSLFYEDYRSIFEKLSCIYKKSRETCEELSLVNHTINESVSSIDVDKHRKIWIDIQAAAIGQRKMKMKYYSLNSGVSERIVRPYAVYKFKGHIYFIAYCEKNEEVRDFKMVRIEEYKILEEKFEKDKNFNFQDYSRNCLGVYRGDDIFIKLKIHYPMAQIIKEQVWVNNQKIIENHDNSITFEATMKGKEEIKTWIKSMGSSALVLEPEHIKEELKKEFQECLKKY